MRIFVDFIDLWGDYEANGEPSDLDRALPLVVLMSPVFLDAAGHRVQAQSPRLFHLESGRFIATSDVTGAALDDLDTLIVVDTDDARFHVAEALASLWVRSGGSARRVSHMAMTLPTATTWWPEITTVH